MATLEEGAYPGSDIIKYEAPSQYSREVVTLTDGEEVVVGSILEVAASKMIACTTEANAVAIALEAAAPDGADCEIVALVRHAIVITDNLDFTTASLTKADVVAALKAVGIVCVDAEDIE